MQTILVHLDGRTRGAQTLCLASRIARGFDCHLATVFASQPPLPVASAMDPAAAVVLEYQADAELAMQSEARAQVAAEEAATGITIEWRTTSLNVVGNIALHARHADLLVMSQDDSGGSMGAGFPISAGVIMGAGRPVLLVPHTGRFESCGDSVLLAWNASRESARAAADAMPFLKAAREVNVVSFHPEGELDHGEIPGSNVGLWLARHHVRATVHERRSRNADAGNQLLSVAADLGADLVVMGAYGHPRAYEFVLGGATRTILRSMTLPVLMSR